MKATMPSGFSPDRGIARYQEKRLKEKAERQAERARKRAVKMAAIAESKRMAGANLRKIVVEQAVQIGILRAAVDLSRACRRCGIKKPSILFAEGDPRVCLQCRVDIAENEAQSLKERLACGSDNVTIRRTLARGEYAGKRLQQAIDQSDGTVTVELLGRMFGEAEGRPCPYCGEYMSRTSKSLDHMVPLNKGGLLALSVGRALCVHNAR